MNYKIEKVEDERLRSLEAYSTEIGDVMEATDGEILLHTFEGFVSLNNPRLTWSKDLCSEVRLLPKGTILKITIQ